MSNSKGIVCINRKLIEIEVKFFNDLAAAINAVSGANLNHETIKKTVIDSLSQKAADSIYNVLRLDELGRPHITPKNSRVQRIADKALDDLILDCSIDEYYESGFDAKAAGVSKTKNSEITPCGTGAKQRIKNNGQIPSSAIEYIADNINNEKLDVLKKIVLEGRSKSARAKELLERLSVETAGKRFSVSTDGKVTEIKEKPKKKVSKKNAKKRVIKKAVKKPAKKKVVKKKPAKKKIAKKASKNK